MSRDVAIPDQAPARARPRPAANLTQRASLNVVASLLDYGAKIAVNFLVIPILVTGLGRSLYGVWEMLGRLVGYLTAGDGRPTQALRLVVATMQASDDNAAKRRYVGAAFGVWIVFAALLGATFWIVVKKYVPWFGVERPTRADVRSLLGLSAWYSAGEAIAKVLLASDVIILGILVSPTAVASYVLTGYAARLAVNIHVLAAGGAIPGIGGVIGRRQYDKAAGLRYELLAVTWLFATAVGGTILLWNRSFLGLWVGSENYAGPVIDLLIVLVMTQTTIIRSDAFVIDSALQPRARVFVAGATVAITIALATLLTWKFGMLGLCIGVFIGRLTQSIAYSVLAHTCLGSQPAPPPATFVRPLAVMAVLFAACAYLSRLVLVQHWLSWAIGAAVTFALILGTAIVAGLPPDFRRAVFARVREARRSLPSLRR